MKIGYGAIELLDCSIITLFLGEYMFVKWIRFIICAIAPLGLILYPTLSSLADDTCYRIGAGDILAISVWKDEGLTQQVSVLPDGTISFPLIGRIDAEGLCLNVLKKQLSERLSRFVSDPILSVQVQQVNSLSIYVIGQVQRPGRFQLVGNIDVLQALSLAGGLNTFAKSGKIKIHRKTKNETEILKFDYSDVSSGKKLEQNITLHRGDVVVVP
jgi:polysaccharide export outer membrane protein